jgi:hypothetical protein
LPWLIVITGGPTLIATGMAVPFPFHRPLKQLQQLLSQER